MGEVDVLAIYPDKLVVAECKGYKKKIGVDEVEEWLNKVSELRKWMRSIEPYRDKRLVSEFWSTGGFEPDALEKIKKVAEKTRKYDIAYFDGPGILNKFREIKSKRILDTLKQYFFNEEL